MFVIFEVMKNDMKSYSQKLVELTENDSYNNFELDCCSGYYKDKSQNNFLYFDFYIGSTKQLLYSPYLPTHPPIDFEFIQD